MAAAVASFVTMMIGAMRQTMEERRTRRASRSPLRVGPAYSVKITPGSTSRSSSTARSSSLST